MAQPTRSTSITEAAQTAYDTVIAATGDAELASAMQQTALAAFQSGANKALEAAAAEIEAVDIVRWAIAGADAGKEAATLVRSRKIGGEK